MKIQICLNRTLPALLNSKMNIAENTKDDSDLSIATCSLIISAAIVMEEDMNESQARESRRYEENAGFRNPHLRGMGSFSNLITSIANGGGTS